MQGAKLCVFYLVGCFLNPIKVAVNVWGWATMSYFWRGSRAYVIFSNTVARWKRLGTTVLCNFNRPGCRI